MSDLIVVKSTRNIVQVVGGKVQVITCVKQGSPGTAGTNGTSIRSGSGAPDNSLGANGDSYLDSLNGDLYAKASGSYSKTGNIKGAPGAPGSIWRTGSGSPDDSVGADGDYFIDGLTGTYYQRTSGIYSLQGNLMGPPGPPGSLNYEHTQVIPAAVWTIEHGLGRYPGVTIVTSAGDTVFGDCQYLDSNTVLLSFSGAFAGKAFLG